MSQTPARYVVVAIVGVMLVGGCADDTSTGDTARRDTAASPSQPGPAASGSTIVGLLKSADDKQVVIILPNGSTRIFLVRPQDLPQLGIEHLASHAGLTDIGFRITYVIIDAKDYILRARETAPPQ